MDGMNDKEFETAKQRFQEAFDYYDTEYVRGDEDVSFALGNQYSEADLSRRREEERPALVENHCMPFVTQMIRYTML